jgi:hypothetical protein
MPSLVWQKWISCSYLLAVAAVPSEDAGMAVSGIAAISLAVSPNTPTARAMFLTACSPRSAKAIESLSLICSFAALEMHTPPGSQSASSRAAILTPSPRISSPSMMISPTLIPMRNTICLSAAMPALRLTMLR